MMKISIKQYQTKTPILVRKITAQQLCEEQLSRINQLITNINNDLRGV